MAGASTKLTDIQVLRAVAIILVLAQHLSLTPTLGRTMSINLSMPYWAGVELFFIISGVVVTQSVLGRPLAPVTFLARRAFRLWPAMLVFVALGAVVAMLAYLLPAGTWGSSALTAQPTEFAEQALAVLLGYFINLGGEVLYTNGAMWSLSVEFQFYAAYALLLALLYPLRLTSDTAKQVVFWIAAALYALTLAQRVALYCDIHVLQSTFIDYVRVWRFDFMLLGVVVAFLPAVSPLRIGPMLVPGLIVFPLVLISLAEDVSVATETGPLHTLIMPAAGLCFALVVYLAKSQSAFTGQGTAVYRVLQWIGDRSFSIYLLHFPAMALVWIAIWFIEPSILSGDPLIYGLVQAITTLVVTFGAAHGCYEYVELPWQEKGKRLLARKNALENKGAVSIGR